VAYTNRSSTASASCPATATTRRWSGGSKHGQVRAGISRSEAQQPFSSTPATSSSFWRTSAAARATRGQKESRRSRQGALTSRKLNKLIENILDEQTDKDELYEASSRASFCACARTSTKRRSAAPRFEGAGQARPQVRQPAWQRQLQRHGVAGHPAKEAAAPQLTKDNWKDAFRDQLQRYKDGASTASTPASSRRHSGFLSRFSERALGFKRFSDLLKALEKDKILEVEMDEQKTMLVKVP
jgi:hypothetical protein